MKRNFMNCYKYPQEVEPILWDRDAMAFEIEDVPVPTRVETFRAKIAYKWWAVKCYLERIGRAILGRD